MIKYLEKEEKFLEEIKDNDVLVDFYANWCGPCRKQAEVLEELDNSKKIDILKIDIDKFPEIAQKYKIFSIPTLILFKGGTILKKEVGFKNIKELLEIID